MVRHLVDHPPGNTAEPWAEGEGTVQADGKVCSATPNSCGGGGGALACIHTFAPGLSTSGFSESL